MRRSSFAEMDCSIARTLEVVGEWWTLLVLREAFWRVRRFDDFQRNLGIARNVLTDRLRTLVDHGILERHLYQERPERHEYRLTEKGLDLWQVVVAMMAWGDRWEPSPDGPPAILRHRSCGHDVVPVMSCPQCGEALHARSVHARRRGEAPPDAATLGSPRQGQRARRRVEAATAG